MSEENQTVGPFPVTQQQKENWKALAKYSKRGLAKQIEFEMDTAYAELEQKLANDE